MKRIIIYISPLLFLFLNFCSDNGAELVEFTEPSPAHVWVEDGVFYPYDIFIEAGGSVTWYIKDNLIVVITSSDTLENEPLFESGYLIQGSKYNRQFDNPGIYRYYNKLDSSFLEGRVYVE